MAHFIVFCFLLTVITVVTSIATVSNDIGIEDLKDTFGAKDFSEWQNDLSAPETSRWQNIFKVQKAFEIKDPTKVAELSSSIQVTAIPSVQVEGIIRYTIGKRVSNDRLVAHGADSKRWSVPQDVTLALKYPQAGQGAIVTYAEIIVNQSSNVGQAHVISGGIGQRFITTIVEAKSTIWFSYTANIYGI